MKINVVDKSTERPVCVVVEGECNHAEVEFETYFENFMVGEDVKEFESQELTCQRCGAWFNNQSELWEDADYAFN